MGEMDQLKFVDLEGPASAPHAGGPPAAGPAAAAAFGGGAGGASTAATATPGSGTDIASTLAVLSWLAASKHPKICFFHLFFKLVALVSYLLFRHVSGDYVITFIVTVVATALDFWTVKNVTGRILVGLRWWNDIKEDGSSAWVFESLSDESIVDSMDRSIFWGALYFWPLLWLVLFIINFVAFNWNWLLLIGMVIVFAMANVVGYWRCSKDQKKRMSEWAKSQAVRAVVGNLL